MRKLSLAFILLILGGTTVHAAGTILYPNGGGTGSSSPSGILYGSNNNTPLQTVTFSGCTFNAGLLTCSGTGAPFAWTAFPSYNATNTPIGFNQGAFFLSSTTFPYLTGGFAAFGTGGLLYRISSSSPLNLSITGTAGSAASTTLLGDQNTFSNTNGNLFSTGFVSSASSTFSSLATGFIGSNGGLLYSFATSSLRAASTTLLTDSNTFSGTGNVFSNAFTVGSLNGFIGGNNGLLYSFATSSLRAASTTVLGDTNSWTGLINTWSKNVLFGTTTALASAFEIASTSANGGTFGQLDLTDNNGVSGRKHWLFSSLNGTFYLGTTTDSGATSTPAALTITNAGVVSLSSALPVASGGTNCTVATITCFNNITAFTSSGTTGGTGNQLVFNNNPTFANSIIVPLVDGGASAGSTLILKSTTAAGTTDALIFQTGNNGAIEDGRILDNSFWGIGTTTPANLFSIVATTTASTIFNGGQLALVDNGAGANLKRWVFASQSGNLSIGTSSDAYATSTTAALTILNDGSLGISTSSPKALFSINPNGISKNSILVGSTSATTQLRLDNGGQLSGYDKTTAFTGVLSPLKHFSLNWATSTAAGIGTTTGAYVPNLTMYGAATLRSVQCLATSTASFEGVSIYVNQTQITPSYFVASTTKGVIAFTAGNTIAAGDNVSMYVGSTTAANITGQNAGGQCTFAYTENLY